MLNIIWPIFIIASFVFAIFSGNIEKINSAITNSTVNAVNLTITLLGTMCLWSGIMQIASESTLVNNLIKVLNPIIKFLFPDLKKEEKIKKKISMNLIANILGLGNAATPLGLEAMQSLQEKNNNKKELSDSMAIFIILNTASMQLIPTTVIAIRSSLNSTNPTKIIFPVWISTICALIVGITVAKLCLKFEKGD